MAWWISNGGSNDKIGIARSKPIGHLYEKKNLKLLNKLISQFRTSMFSLNSL